MAAYLIFHNKVSDAETLNNEYLPKALETLAPYDFEVLVADENGELLEGETDLHRTVVLKFASRDDAKRWYNSPEYQAVLPLRLQSSHGTGVLVDGFE